MSKLHDFMAKMGGIVKGHPKKVIAGALGATGSGLAAHHYLSDEDLETKGRRMLNEAGDNVKHHAGKMMGHLGDEYEDMLGSLREHGEDQKKRLSRGYDAYRGEAVPKGKGQIYGRPSE